MYGQNSELLSDGLLVYVCGTAPVSYVRSRHRHTPVPACVVLLQVWDTGGNGFVRYDAAAVGADAMGFVVSLCESLHGHASFGVLLGVPAC